MKVNINQGGSLNLKIGKGSCNTDYPPLTNKPSIEGHVLLGDKTFPQLGLDTLSVQEIEKILYLD